MDRSGSVSSVRFRRAIHAGRAARPGPARPPGGLSVRSGPVPPTDGPAGLDGTPSVPSYRIVFAAGSAGLRAVRDGRMSAGGGQPSISFFHRPASLVPSVPVGPVSPSRAPWTDVRSFVIGQCNAIRIGLA